MAKQFVFISKITFLSELIVTQSVNFHSFREISKIAYNIWPLYLE